MKNIVRNIILIVALSAVILMVIGILIYDYIPSANTVAEPSTYETDSTTTKIIAEINDNSSSLTSTTDSSSSTSSSTSSVVLKSYSITETDLAIYSASNSYNKGKSDPFAAYSETTTDDGESGETTGSSSGDTTSSSSSSSSTSGNTTSSSSSSSSSSSDGTLFNSTSSK